MMDGQARRKEIIRILTESEKAVSGTFLAKKCGVSRQVIVQDIALIRAENKNILSTNKGYILFRPDKKEIFEVICVKHNAAQVYSELCTIVDFGGRVLDVFVEHEIYGQIKADLIINNRRDADEFVQNMNDNNVKPLTMLTDGLHYHTIAAPDRETIEKIKEELAGNGFLAENL